MTPKVFVGWAFAAVASAVAAVAVALGQPAISTVALDHEPAFPMVRGKANDVAKLGIRSADGSFTLERGDDGRWIAADKFGYPADSKKVRELIVTMADMKLIEAKTRRPDRYARLEVEDVDDPDAQSRHVRLETADGTVLAEAIIGKNRYRLTGRSESGTYIRRPGEALAWLASGHLSPDKSLTGWLETGIVDLARETVRRVEISPHGGQPYVAARADKDAAFRIDNVPEGRAVKEGATSSFEYVLANVDLTDVAPRSQIDLPAARHKAAVTTFDGFEVSVELGEIDEAHWAVFSARYAGAPDADTAAAARERVQEFNDRVGAWIYQIPAYVAERLSKPIDELLEESQTTS